MQCVISILLNGSPVINKGSLLMLSLTPEILWHYIRGGPFDNQAGGLGFFGKTMFVSQCSEKKMFVDQLVWKKNVCHWSSQKYFASYMFKWKLCE